jgi:hypothetical protein
LSRAGHHPANALAAAIVVLACPLVIATAAAQTMASAPVRAASLPARAPVNRGGPAWSSLTAAQRAALAPLERDWSAIDAQHKAKWLELASRLPSLPTDERKRMHERMVEWARLTPDERGRARLSFQEAKQLPPGERQAKWQAYQALPESERRALAERAGPHHDKAAGAASAAPASRPGLAANKPVNHVTVKRVAPTIVQAQPGATTTLMTRKATPPAYQKPGQTKIVAAADKVDRVTLLPQSGPQHPVSRAASASSAPSHRP